MKEAIVVSADPLAARVHALIAQWREEAQLEAVERHPNWVGAESALRGCADALEAALAAAPRVSERLSPRDRARKCLTVLAHEGGATIRLSGLTLTDIHVDLEQIVADAIADAEAAALAAALAPPNMNIIHIDRDLLKQWTDDPFAAVLYPDFSTQLVDAMNEQRWKDATFLLIDKLHSVYKQPPAAALAPHPARTEE